MISASGGKCGSLSPPETFEQLAELGPQQALTLIAEGFSELMAHPDVVAMHRVVTSEALNNPRIAELLYEAGPERYTAAFVAMLRAFHERGQLDIPDPALACEQFFHMVKGEYHQRLLLNLKPKPTREARLAYARACVQTFLRAFAPWDPGPQSGTGPVRKGRGGNQ